MDKTAFIDAATRIFGKSGWRGQLAEALAVDRSTIWRYEKGKREIPETVALAMEALTERARG